MDALEKLDFYSKYFEEALRMQPAVNTGLYHQITEDVTFANGFKLLANDTISVDTRGIAHDPTVWHSPNEFIPERFDPSSKYYLTPDGKKRSIFSSSPFLGGQRVCMGKSFAMMTSRLVAPQMVLKYNIEPVNLKKGEFPNVNVMTTCAVPVPVKLTSAGIL